jgi:hypothetical protein
LVKAGWISVKTFGIWGTFFLLFEFFAPNLLQIDPFEYVLKSFIFGLLSTVGNWVVKSPKSDN